MMHKHLIKGHFARSLYATDCTRTGLIFDSDHERIIIYNIPTVDHDAVDRPEVTTMVHGESLSSLLLSAIYRENYYQFAICCMHAFTLIMHP